MEAARAKKRSLIAGNLPLIAAFLAPVFVLLLIYIGREIFPFGDQMYLRSDMYHQYAPFLKLFQSILKEGGSLSYSFRIGLGTNFVSTYAYYLASPLNWLLAVLPSDYIPEIMSAFIFLKSGLMSAFFAYYLRRRFRKNTMLLAGFGTLYAMSGYMAAYSWNVMWLDCLVLLPLMLLGLEKLIREKKAMLYTIVFALAVISNYYIAIMLCIFSLLYSVYLLLCEARLQGFRDGLGRFGRYLLYSFLGGCIGAAVFLPALLTLFGTASADSAFPDRMKAYFNLLELFAHGTMNAEVTMMDGYVPNIYAGIAVFALVPLFWLNKKIPVRERAGKTILMGIFLFSFSFNIPSFIWHGFHFPNSLPSRQSFIYIALVLLISYEALLKVKETAVPMILASFGAAAAAVFALQAILDSEKYPVENAWISAGFLLLYLFLTLVYRLRVRALRILGTVLLFAAFLAEAGINTDATGYGTTSRLNYTEDNGAIRTVLDEIKDPDFYRVEKQVRRTKNDGAWNGYRSASVFSSVTSAALSDVYDSFGMQHGTNSFSWYGHTPLTSALLNVKYQLAAGESGNPFLSYVTDRKGIWLYQSRYTLPLGFMIRTAAQAEVNLTANNPFEVQNDFLDAAKGIGPVFESGERLEGETIRYTALKSGPLYFFVDSKVKTLSIARENAGAEDARSSFTNLECPMIVFAGEAAEGDTFLLSFKDEEAEKIAAVPAFLEEEALQEAVSALGAEPFQTEEFRDGFVSGEVTAQQSGMLFMSIPYDDGWEVFVDGEKTEYKDFYGAFLQIPVSSGTHRLELRYRVPGFAAGLFISLLSLAVFCALQILVFRRKKAAHSEEAQPEVFLSEEVCDPEPDAVDHALIQDSDRDQEDEQDKDR